MSQNRICFSNVLKAEGAEQSANQRAKRFVRAMGKNKVYEIADTVSLYMYKKNVSCLVPCAYARFCCWKICRISQSWPTFTD